MSENGAHVPEGWPAVIPRLSVEFPLAAVEFLKRVFDAEGDYVSGRPSELRIGNSLIMVAGILDRAPSKSSIYVYVPDTDESYRRALELGATSIEPPAQMPYGDRRGMIEDLWGNRWQIATHGAFTEAGT